MNALILVNVVTAIKNVQTIQTRRIAQNVVQKLSSKLNVTQNHQHNLKLYKTISCRESQECIPDYKRCDNNEDCSDGADEQDCNRKYFELQPKTFFLRFGTNQKSVQNFIF